MSTRHVMHAGAPGDTWQNGPPLEWLAKIARPPTPSQELAGPKLPSLGAISEEPELHLSNSGGQCAPQIPSLFLVRPHIIFIIFTHASDVKDHESSTQGHVIKIFVSVIREIALCNALCFFLTCQAVAQSITRCWQHTSTGVHTYVHGDIGYSVSDRSACAAIPAAGASVPFTVSTRIPSFRHRCSVRYSAQTGRGATPVCTQHASSRSPKLL